MNKPHYDYEECKKIIKKLGVSSDYLVIKTEKGNNICIDRAYFEKLKQEMNRSSTEGLGPKNRFDWDKIRKYEAIPVKEEGNNLTFDYAIKMFRETEKKRIIIRTLEMIQTYIYPNCFSWLTKALDDDSFFGEISCCEE